MYGAHVVDLVSITWGMWLRLSDSSPQKKKKHTRTDEFQNLGNFYIHLQVMSLLLYFDIMYCMQSSNMSRDSD